MTICPFPHSTKSLGLLKGTSTVVPYSNEWPIRFKEERNRILRAFSNIKCDLEHIGSTAIKDLPAKPVIDIALALEPKFKMNEVISTFKSLGYRHHKPKKSTDNHWFEYGEDRSYYQAYVFTRDSMELNRHLIFCKELTSNAKARNAYAQIKQEASKRFGNAPRQYVEFKRSFIDEIIKNASNDE
jgi:GrpB-like predicted nucleotidyltransferase (UPF0157 family)